VHPYLFHVGHIVIPTFGVLAACGLMLAIALSQYTARLTHVDQDKLWDAGLFAILAAFLISRLMLIASHLRTFISFPVLLLAVPSLTATGLLLTAIATFLWLRFRRIPLLPALDAWAPCATLVWAFLALGHFAEGSDPGMPTRGDSTRLYPVAIYAAVAGLALTLVLLVKLKRGRSGGTAAMALVCSGLLQFLLSFLRQPGERALAGLDALQMVALGMAMVGGLMWATADRDPDSLR
jgi:phosphatidylglycerol:prolipoprotein diacylglycerol transferase